MRLTTKELDEAREISQAYVNGQRLAGFSVEQAMAVYLRRLILEVDDWRKRHADGALDWGMRIAEQEAKMCPRRIPRVGDPLDTTPEDFAGELARAFKFLREDGTAHRLILHCNPVDLAIVMGEIKRSDGAIDVDVITDVEHAPHSITIENAGTSTIEFGIGVTL